MGFNFCKFCDNGSKWHIIFWRMAIKMPILPNLSPSKISHYTVIYIYYCIYHNASLPIHTHTHTHTVSVGMWVLLIMEEIWILMILFIVYTVLIATEEVSQLIICLKMFTIFELNIRVMECVRIFNNNFYAIVSAYNCNSLTNM